MNALLDQKTIKFENGINNYAFDCGYEIGFEDGKEAGYKEGMEAGRKVGLDEVSKQITKAIERIFNERYDFENAVFAAETFIKLFNEKFPGYSITQARIGLNPSNYTPTAFFVTNVVAGSDEDDALDNLKRFVEKEVFEKRNGQMVCIWSVENTPDLCESTIKSDYPFLRKAL